MLVKARGSLLAKKCHAKREQTNSEYPFTVVVKTGELIVGHEKLPQFARCFYENDFLSSYGIRCSTTMCSASSTCHQQEIFGGKDFCGKKFLQAGV